MAQMKMSAKMAKSWLAEKSANGGSSAPNEILALAWQCSAKAARKLAKEKSAAAIMASKAASASVAAESESNGYQLA